MPTLIPIGALPGGGGGGGGPITASQITDAQAAGIALLTANDVAAQRTLLNVPSVSQLPTWSSITGKPAVVAAGADAATVRTQIGAGTSDLTLGSSGSTALAGNATVAGQSLAGNPSAATLATALGVATTSQKGTLALATNTQAQTGTDAALAITAASMAATQRPLFVTLNPYWPLNWVAGTGWPARTTIPQWYRDLGGLARYVADSPTLVAGSVSLPSDKQDKDRIYALPGLIPGT